jgi:hypothetical protein
VTAMVMVTIVLIPSSTYSTNTKEARDFYSVNTIGRCRRLLWDNNHLDICNNNNSQEIFININNSSCSMVGEDWDKFYTIVTKTNKYIYTFKHENIKH